MSTLHATPQANKENSGDDPAAQAIVTPTSLDGTASSTGSLSKQRVIFSKRNQEHFFPPVLAAHPTPLSSQEPSKSILKKRSYDEFLADDALFSSLVPQRSSTPEPDTEDGLNAYLLSPVTTLVQSVKNTRARPVNNQDIIEAYCVLTARIRAKFLPGAMMNGTNEDELEAGKALHPAMEPVKEYLDLLVCAMTRDITRAMEDPLEGVDATPATETPLGMSDANAAATLPSPPSSSPSPFDSQATPKRGGMNEQQVKHARDLCTVSQSAMRLLATLFAFTDSIHSGELFNEEHLATLLGALLAIPLSSPLPTPNSRKTSALSITILTAFSTLISPVETSFSPVIAGVISPNVRAITSSLRRGIDGELGREGKKGATADSLRAVIRFSIAQPHFFAKPFATTLVPSLIKVLGANSGVLQANAGNALASVASAIVKAEVTAFDLQVNASGAKIDIDLGMLLRACFAIRPSKTKDGDVQLMPVLHTITKYFQTLNAVCASRDAAANTSFTDSDGKDVTKNAPTPALQAAAHMSAMWSLTVFSSMVVLTDGCLFRPTTRKGLKNHVSTGTGDGSAPATTTAKIIRMMLDNKRIAIRTAASWAWRAFTWTVVREFERMDGEEDPQHEATQETVDEAEDCDEEPKYTKCQQQRMDLIRRIFDFVDKGVGIGVMCALLVGSAGREDRDMRLDLTVELLLIMTRRRPSTFDGLQALQHLVTLDGAPDEEQGGPALGWDINKLLPAALFDGRLAEADSKSLLTLARDEREANREAEWVDEIMPLTKLECSERLPAFFEVWQTAVRAHGLADKGAVSPAIVETWEALIKRTSKPPSEQIMFFLSEPPHLWLNVADPGDDQKQSIAHRVVQARFVTAIMRALVQRFGPSRAMKKLVMEIYDRCLAVFQFGPGDGKVQDVCIELFFVLAEVEGAIVTLVMEHESLDEDVKTAFWRQSALAAHDEELLRALAVAPFGEPRPFEFTEEEWKSWEELWLRYLDQRGESCSDRSELQRLFADQLSGNVSPHEACRIVSSIIGTLPLPIRPSSDIAAHFTLINQSLVIAYQSGAMEIMELATSNLCNLTKTFPLLTNECFSLLTAGLITWISDPESLLTDEDYELIAGSTYDAVLQFIRALPVNEETLAEHSEILSCITSRVTPRMVTVKAFHSFWTEVYADVVEYDNAPPELCTLLLAMDGASLASSQDAEEFQELPPASDDEGEPPGGTSFELPDPETSSSFTLSPPPSPPSDAETLEEYSEDPLSVVAPASEAPEENECEQHAIQKLARWTGSYEDLGRHPDSVNGKAPSPAYGVSKMHERYAFSFQSPEGSTPGLGLFTATTSVPTSAPSHPSLNISGMRHAGISSGSSGEVLSPNSRKRRSWDEDVCTPVKRRKQEKDESDDSDDDSTPIRPWFDADYDHEKAEIPGLVAPVVPFQPFSRNNLPKGPYRFSGSKGPNPSVESSRINIVSQRSARAAPSLQSNGSHQAPMSGTTRTFFVNSGPVERNNPSTKRRRVVEPPAGESPLSLAMAPYSDEARPSSDDVKSDPFPDSDDTVTIGGVSPNGIVSPAMATVEPGSDESTESPLKAHLDRKKRLQDSRLRVDMSQMSASSSTKNGRGATIPKNLAHVPSQTHLVDIQAQQAILTACQLMPSMDQDGLLRMSSFLEQMHAKLQDEMRRKSTSGLE